MLNKTPSLNRFQKYYHTHIYLAPLLYQAPESTQKVQNIYRTKDSLLDSKIFAQRVNVSHIYFQETKNCQKLKRCKIYKYTSMKGKIKLFNGVKK